MKKFTLLAILIIFSSSVYAIDEADLQEVFLKEPSSEQTEIMENASAEINNIANEDKSLREKLHDVYNIEVYKYNKPYMMFSEILSKRFSEDSKMDRIQTWVGYNGDLGFNFHNDGGFEGNYDINVINWGFDGYLKDNNADFRLLFNVSPFSTRNVMQNLITDAYIATNKIPHHRLLVGNSRPAVGVEGSYSSFTLPFMHRAQISRNFGTVRKFGARVMGNYDLVEYDIGGYSSDTYWQEFFPGAEFIGWINFKPLGKTDGRYGRLKLGGGLQSGHRDNNYCVTGAYVGYEYKRFMANFEWANADGYNGPIGHSVNKHAGGFYATLGYMITKKLQCLLRYDEFNPDKNLSNNKKREYSAGLNYYIKGQGLKLMFNYIFCQNENAKDSHRIMFGTQIML